MGIVPPSRYPCGKLKRDKTTAQKLSDMARAQADAEMATALAQPHRRWLGDRASSPLAECALGRFVLTHRLRKEFYDAAEQWALVKRKWLKSMGERSLPADGGNGMDTPMALVHAWRDECMDGEFAMVRCGTADGALSVVNMAFHGAEFAPGASVTCAIRALAGLAHAQGRIDKRILDGILGDT